MAGHVSDSHLAKLSFTVSRPRIPFGWRYMAPDVIVWSAVCSSAPHSQDAVQRHSPIYALMTERGQIQSGDSSAGPRRVWEAQFQVGRASKNECRREVPSRHSMLHLWSAHLAALVPSSLASLSSSRAVGTKECLDLSCRCPS